MASPEVHHLFHHPIADHSFSADRQTLAVAKDNTVELYKKSANRFTLAEELKGHDKTVTGVDIAPNSGMIVTCSQGMFLPTASIRPAIDKLFSRPKRLRLGTLSHRQHLEAHTSPPAHQSSRHLRPLVSLRTQIRSRIRRKSNSSLLLRRRERLVGQQAPKEAHPQHHHHSLLAPQLRPLSCRKHRQPRASLLRLH